MRDKFSLGNHIILKESKGDFINLLLNFPCFLQFSLVFIIVVTRCYSTKKSLAIKINSYSVVPTICTVGSLTTRMIGVLFSIE